MKNLISVLFTRILEMATIDNPIDWLMEVEAIVPACKELKEFSNCEQAELVIDKMIAYLQQDIRWTDLMITYTEYETNA